MAVKTITVDLEAYDALSRRKKKGQSFSQVIKEHFAKSCTGRELDRWLEEVSVSEELLSALDEQVQERSGDTPRKVEV
jgi:predicted CopG family antitoxin